jgi:hypothetical protein
MINDSMTQCRYCNVAVDPGWRRLIAERQEKANQSYSDASYLRTAVDRDVCVHGLSFIPYVPLVGGASWLRLSSCWCC